MRIVWTIILLAVLVILGVWVSRGNRTENGEPSSSTQNGAPVTPPSVEASYTLEAKLNEMASGPGIKITPITLVEDSRCPIDVTCIQAGTVRVRAKIEGGLGTSEMELDLNTPITTEAETVMLYEVVPAPHSEQTIEAADYIFKFRIAKMP